MRFLLLLIFCVPLLAVHVHIQPGTPELLRSLYSKGITVGKQTAEGWDVYLQPHQLKSQT